MVDLCSADAAASPTRANPPSGIYCAVRYALRLRAPVSDTQVTNTLEHAVRW